MSDVGEIKESSPVESETERECCAARRVLIAGNGFRPRARAFGLLGTMFMLPPPIAFVAWSSRRSICSRWRCSGESGLS